MKQKFLDLMKLDADTGTGAGSVPAEPETPDPESPKEPEANEDGSQKPKYSDEDLDRIIAAKFAKWEQKKQKEVDEAEKLANMSAEEKTKHLEEKAQDALNKLARYEMAGTARKMLAENNISVDDGLLDMLIAHEAEKTKANVESFSTLFSNAVTAEVEKRLKGKTPPAGQGGAGLTRADIEAIQDPVERQKAIASNIKLFEV